METVLRYFQIRSFGRGMSGRNTAWFVVAAALWMLIRARRSEDVVYRTKLLPGERLLVRAGSPDPSSSPGS
jgi:hypothetical protein